MEGAVVVEVAVVVAVVVVAVVVVVATVDMAVARAAEAMVKVGLVKGLAGEAMAVAVMGMA